MFTWQHKKIDFNYCMYLAIENYRVTYKNNAHSPDFVLMTIATDCTSIRCFSQHLIVLLFVLDFFTLVHL